MTSPQVFRAHGPLWFLEARRCAGVAQRNEALVATDPTLAYWLIVAGYCRRWSVEVAFCDAKQQLGFHDPQVWSAQAVERATPMAWLVGTLVVLWYAESGNSCATVTAST